MRKYIIRQCYYETNSKTHSEKIRVLSVKPTSIGKQKRKVLSKSHISQGSVGNSVNNVVFSE